MWSEFRTVTKTATVSLHGNTYQVDELLTGRKVELVFDLFDLADIEVRYGGRGFGKAVAFTIGRHAHPKARPEQPGQPVSPSAGINYLHADRHRARQPAGPADQLHRPVRRHPAPRRRASFPAR